MSPSSMCAQALFIPALFGHAGTQDVARSAAAAVWSQTELERVSEDIRRDIEEMRGLKFKRPVQVKLTDKAGFVAYARQRIATTQTPERMERDELVAKLLGLIPFGMDLEAKLLEFLEDQVGGFYDPGSDTFYLLESFTGDIARIILAHELTHALDDQCFDLDGTLKRLRAETDAELAYQSVVEGSGMALMKEWTIKHMKELSFESLLEADSLGTESLADAPAYIWKPLLAVYLRGEGFLTKSRAMNFLQKKAKTEDVEAAFRSPPRSTEQILHPDKYWDEAERDEPRRVSFDLSKLDAGWRVMGEDTLGELLLALVIAPPDERGGIDAKNPLAMLGIKYTYPAAEGWGGDRVVLLANGDARCLVLVSLWDSKADAEEFRAELGQVFEGALHRDSLESGPAYALGALGPGDSVVLTAHWRLAQSALPALAWSEIESSAADAGPAAERKGR